MMAVFYIQLHLKRIKTPQTIIQPKNINQQIFQINRLYFNLYYIICSMGLCNTKMNKPQPPKHPYQRYFQQPNQVRSPFVKTNPRANSQNQKTNRKDADNGPLSVSNIKQSQTRKNISNNQDKINASVPQIDQNLKVDIMETDSPVRTYKNSEFKIIGIDDKSNIKGDFSSIQYSSKIVQQKKKDQQSSQRQSKIRNSVQPINQSTSKVSQLQSPSNIRNSAQPINENTSKISQLQSPSNIRNSAQPIKESTSKVSQLQSPSNIRNSAQPINESTSKVSQLHSSHSPPKIQSSVQLISNNNCEASQLKGSHKIIKIDHQSEIKNDLGYTFYKKTGVYPSLPSISGFNNCQSG